MPNLTEGMKKHENFCVDCPTELGCYGSGCPYTKVPVYYCDNCGNDHAEYNIDGEDLCEHCAELYLQDAFDDLTVTEKAEALQIEIKDIYR